MLDKILHKTPVENSTLLQKCEIAKSGILGEKQLAFSYRSRPAIIKSNSRQKLVRNYLSENV